MDEILEEFFQEKRYPDEQVFILLDRVKLRVGLDLTQRDEIYDEKVPGLKDPIAYRNLSCN